MRGFMTLDKKESSAGRPTSRAIDIFGGGQARDRRERRARHVATRCGLPASRGSIPRPPTIFLCALRRSLRMRRGAFAISEAGRVAGFTPTTGKDNTMSKNKKRHLEIGAAWALAAFVATASTLPPEKAQPWLDAAERIRPQVEANDRLVTLKELRKLPTWSLKAVAEAAAQRPFQTKRTKAIAAGLMTELERRRAKSAGETV